MFSFSFSFPGNAKRSSNAGRRATRRLGKSFSRQLLLEPLEDRALLSVSLGLAPSAAVSAIVASNPLGGTTQSTLAATQIALHIPANVQAGATYPVFLVVENTYGGPASGYSGTVTLSSSDAGAVFSSTTITFNNGFPTNNTPVTVTFATSGAQTVTASDNSTTPLTATANTTVAPAAVATQISLRLPANTQEGLPVPLWVMVQDSQGHPVPNYSGTVTLTSSDTAAVFSSTTVTFKNGFPQLQGPVTVTFATSGAQTVTATDNSATPLTVTANTTVAAAAVASQIKFQLPSSVQAGQPVPLWIMVTEPRVTRFPAIRGR